MATRDRSKSGADVHMADGEVREPFFEPPRGNENDDPEVYMGDGGVREPFFEPPQ